MKNDSYFSNAQLDEKFMQRAIVLAKKSRPSPNPRVGAILVKNNRIIGEGYHKKAGENHAEINAFRDAKRKGNASKIKDSTLYVTLEPCCTQGRTPPCTDAIIKEKISEVVIGAVDPNPNVSGKGIITLLKNNIKVKKGILEEECTDLNEGWNYYISHNHKPFVVLKAALSLDGKIAASTGDSKWITNESARILVHHLRTKYDAILVGIGTVKKDNPSLTSRIKNGLDPKRIIIDSNLAISLNAKVLADKNVLIITSENYNKTQFQKLTKKGIEIMVCGKTKVDLKKAIRILPEKGITSILIEGGSNIYSTILENKLASKGIFFIAPLIIGGEKSPSLLKNGVNKVSRAIKLKNQIFTTIDDNILVEGDF